MDKPVGPTSHDVVAIARRAFATRRVGHGGTLDPFASGLLPLLVGRATRLMPWIVGLDKRYDGILRLGERTTTDDLTGEAVGGSEAWRELTPDAVRQAMTALTGTIRQVPPTYSAKKVGGRAAHRRARAGQAVTLTPQTVEVRRFRWVDQAGPDVRFAAEVGSGTYLRALARDLGEALGCGAHLRALRRTGVGAWDLESAAPLEHVADGRVALEPPLAALPHLPRVDAGPADADALGHGRPIPAGTAPAGPVAVVRDGALVAIAERDGEVLRPRMVLAA